MEEAENYQKLARLAAVLYVQEIYTTFPEVEQRTIHRVDKEVLTKFKDVNEQLSSVLLKAN
jgi:hypothetical protein